MKYERLRIFHGPSSGDDLTDCIRERDELAKWWRWNVEHSFEATRNAMAERLEAQVQLRIALSQQAEMCARMTRLERKIDAIMQAQKMRAYKFRKMGTNK